MDMKPISQRPTDAAGLDPVAARRMERATKANRTDSERVQRGDSLEISDKAREMARAREAVEAAPDVRADRVESIKKRIEDGTYSVSPELLARKLLEGSGRAE